MTAGGPILVLDTATTRAVIAVGDPDGTLRAERGWVAGYRHGEELLAQIESLLAVEGIAPHDLGGIVVGTGPGAFTGLRVGIATAKGLAHALDLPIVGVATGEALLAAATAAQSPAGDASAGGAVVLLQPAGPSDRVVTRHGEPAELVAGGDEPALRPGETVVAVDLDERAPAAAIELGVRAHEALAACLLLAGAARLTAGDPDDLARLVPEYVTLPRGVRADLPDAAVEVSGGATAR